MAFSAECTLSTLTFADPAEKRGRVSRANCVCVCVCVWCVCVCVWWVGVISDNDMHHNQKAYITIHEVYMYNYVGSLVKLFQRKNYANSLSNLLDTGLLETRPELLERGANWANLFDEFSPVLERPAPQCREEMSHPLLQLRPQISLLQHRPTQLHTHTLRTFNH